MAGLTGVPAKEGSQLSDQIGELSEVLVDSHILEIGVGMKRVVHRLETCWCVSSGRIGLIVLPRDAGSRPRLRHHIR